MVRVVKGVNFLELRDAGKSGRHRRATTTSGRRRADLPRHHRHQRRPRPDPASSRPWPRQVFIPLTVGGGVRTVDDVRRLSTPAPTRSASTRPPSPTRGDREASDKYGSQCIVVAIDAKRRKAEDELRLGSDGRPVGPAGTSYSHGGRKTSASTRSPGPRRWPNTAPANPADQHGPRRHQDPA